MSSAECLSNLPSPEFVMLCQAQSRLVQQGFQVDWCGVYLTRSPGARFRQTRTNSEDPELIPIVLYPPPEASSYDNSPLITLSRQQRHNVSTLPGLLPSGKDAGDAWDLEESIASPLGTEDYPQLVLPLVYQEVMLGVLVAGRKSPCWQTEEVAQLENIARTLAIACFLDQQKSWYLQQLRQQEMRHKWEREQLDDLFHQLRNPLTALITFSQLLFKRFKGDEKTQAVIQGIGRESHHLQALLQTFEGERAATDGEITVPVWEAETSQENIFAPVSPFLLPSSSFSLIPIVLEEILEPILFSEYAIAQERQIQLNRIIPRNLPPIWGNMTALREIFSNLIDNALKYTQSGGTVRVTMGLICPKEPSRWQGVEIADTGFGIPLQDQDRIFERHYRGIQSQGNIPGTGLGLAIVKELLEKMQGKIEIISPNQLSLDPSERGTTFIVWLLANNPNIH